MAGQAGCTRETGDLRSLSDTERRRPTIRARHRIFGAHLVDDRTRQQRLGVERLRGEHLAEICKCGVESVVGLAQHAPQQQHLDGRVVGVEPATQSRFGAAAGAGIEQLSALLHFGAGDLDRERQVVRPGKQFSVQRVQSMAPWVLRLGQMLQHERVLRWSHRFGRGRRDDRKPDQADHERRPAPGEASAGGGQGQHRYWHAPGLTGTALVEAASNAD
jgi:hypothetical protein